MNNNNYAHRLVGHRGSMATHPENTLIGFKAAIAAGAKFIECDLQLTKDKQAVLLHDQKVSRTSRKRGFIFDKPLTEAKGISMHQPKVFGDKYDEEPMATLGELLDTLAAHADVTAMVEVKQESIKYFGLQAVLDAVMPLCTQFKEQVVIISFNADVVTEAKNAGMRVGWVVDEMNADNEQQAAQLKPQYVITDVVQFEGETPKLWNAPEGHNWQWMLYDVTDADQAKSLMDNGVDLIETADLTGLLKHFES